MGAVARAGAGGMGGAGVGATAGAARVGAGVGGSTAMGAVARGGAGGMAGAGVGATAGARSTPETGRGAGVSADSEGSDGRAGVKAPGCPAHGAIWAA